MSVPSLCATWSPTISTYGTSGDKAARRLLTSLHVARDAAAADRLIRTFVSGGSKTTTLAAASFLFSTSSPYAIPLFDRIRDQAWYGWNPKLAAAAAALLACEGHCSDSDSLISCSLSNLKSLKERSSFLLELIEAFCDRKLYSKATVFYAELDAVPFFGQKHGESIVKALCSMDLPSKAEEKIARMASLGYHASSFDLRLVAQCYGELGFFSDMERLLAPLMQDDTVAANVALSCYGEHAELLKMESWLRKMREKTIPCSIRTYNAVINSCPTIVAMIQALWTGSHDIPRSVDELLVKLQRDGEVELVTELVKCPVWDECLRWAPEKGMLDLHGFHEAATMVVVLQWAEELRNRMRDGNFVPKEVSLVCGVGNHSKHGKGKVKKVVREVLAGMGGSRVMRLDRSNTGRFLAKGNTVQQWLC